MTARVTARKHRGINNNMNKNNSEGVHTQTYFCLSAKAPSDLKRLKRMVPQEMRTKTEITPRNTSAPITFAKPFPRAGPIPIVPDNMQVGEELVRWKMHTFRLPSLEVPIQVCLRAKVPHIHAQPSKVRGAVLVATITARITSLIPPTFHSCETAARTMMCLDLNERHNELHKLV